MASQVISSFSSCGYNLTLIFFNPPINDEVYFAGSLANSVANTEHDYAKIKRAKIAGIEEEPKAREKIHKLDLQN